MNIINYIIFNTNNSCCRFLNKDNRYTYFKFLANRSRQVANFR